MSKFIGFIVGAIEIGVGIATGNPALIITGVLTIAAQAAADLTMPKGAKSRNALETELQLGEVARRVIFGKTATAGSLVDAFNYGGKYGTDHEVVIFALADHECEELVEFYVNDLKITYTGDGAYTEIDPTADSPHLYVYFRSGTEDQTLPTVVTDEGPGWTSADNGAGICYVVVDYRADKPDNKKLAFPGGRPSFLWVLKGAKVYDPRLDDTVGGSGSHRWDDPSTREWSENPIVCAYNYRRGIYACHRVDQPEMLLIGRGLTETEAPPSYIFSDANLCDEVMDDDLPRYTIGGIIAADERYIDAEEKFAAACGGIIIQPEGTVQIEVAQARTPSFTFTDDDIIVGSTVEYNQGVLSQASSDWVNTTIPQYVSPAQKWQDHAAPVRRVQADVLADGGSREEQIQLQLVTNERQASDIGEIHRKLGRLWGRGSVVLGPDHADVEDGDWGTWTSARLGISMTVRVEGYSLDAKWQNTLNLREINSAVYDGVLGAGDPTGSATDWDQTTPPIDTGAPDSGNWALAAITITDASGIETPALEITGDTTDDDSAEAIIFEYWKDDGVIDPVTNPDDPTWSVWGTLPPSTTKVDITGVEGGADYFAAVTYVVSGAPGDRLVLGPVTAGSTDISGAVNPLVTAGIAGLSWKQPVRAKTDAVLDANTYANGSSGVGATLTGNANGALAAVDGVTLAVGNRLLVDQESAGSHNGIYVVTQVGDGSHPYILTRATDADAPAELVNATCKISEGTTFADQEWQCTTNATITVGTTALVWAAAGGGSVQSLLDGISSTQGTVLYRSASAWSALAPGAVGQFLQTNGGGANPIWATIAGSIGGAFIGASVKKSADQTGTNFTTAVPLVWDSEIADVGGWHHFTSTVTITIASPGVITWNAHGFSNNNAIKLSTTGALPTGLTAGTTYYVVNAAANTFQLAATPGGAAINTSGSQSGTHTATNDSVLRVPAGVNFVQVGANVRMTNVTASDVLSFLLSKNGSSVFDGAAGVNGQAGGASPRISISSGTIPVVLGDNFEVTLGTTADTSADVTASVSDFWITAVG